MCSPGLIWPCLKTSSQLGFRSNVLEFWWVQARMLLDKASVPTRALTTETLCVCVCVCVCTHVRVLSHSVMSDSATSWTVAHQAPLSVGFSRQEHWSGLPCPPPGDLPDSGTEPMSPTLAGGFLTTEATWKAPRMLIALILRNWHAEYFGASLHGF